MPDAYISERRTNRGRLTVGFFRTHCEQGAVLIALAFIAAGCKRRRENPSVKRPDRPAAPEQKSGSQSKRRHLKSLRRGAHPGSTHTPSASSVRIGASAWITIVSSTSTIRAVSFPHASTITGVPADTCQAPQVIEPLRLTGDTAFHYELPAGARRIRNAGVARRLSEGKGARVLEKFGVENGQHLRRMSSLSIRYDARR